MHFDNTITLGAVMQLVGMAVLAIAAYHAVNNKIELFKAILEDHAEALKKHDATLGIYETRIFDLVGGLQRLIGRFESAQRQREGHK